jgi:hypothetical protein
VKTHDTYGIYEGEIDRVLALVRSHEPLAKIEAIPCPCCRAPIAITFWPYGEGFQVSCSGSPPHFSTYQEIALPPAWWKQRIGDFRPITFYWREWGRYREDGTLEMKASGYDGEGAHWTGHVEIPRHHADYRLWKWILEQSGRFKDHISCRDLEVIREEFLRSL